MLIGDNTPMKSTLFASTLAAALTATTFGQVDVVQIDECCSPWETNWDGTTLSFYAPECFGYTTWEFSVPEETTVTYQVDWLPCEQFPRVFSPFGYVGQFENIEQDWLDQGQPLTWSGTFTLEPGIYERIYFAEFQGALTFGPGCEAGTDTDGDGVDDCDDGCPEDPFKSAPGDCGCGVEDLDSDKDGVADCNDGCPTDPTKTSPGDCGCNASDADGDGVDDCVDNCPDDPNKTDPGDCGCGNEDTDTDGDGTADCVDNCPDDPDKTEPGFCGCGTVDTNVNGDVDCDGDYDIDDAIAAMADFDLGQDDCPADVDGDGSIGFSDVLIILNDWGACP